MTFKKGQSGNLKGRPAGAFSLVQLLKDKLQDIPEGEKENFATKAIDNYMKLLAEGRPDVWKDTFDRIDGKPVQRNETDLTSKGEQITGFVIEFVGDEEKGPISTEA